jgi:hypothetical protein
VEPVVNEPSKGLSQFYRTEVYVSPKQAKRFSEVVFQGTIDGFKGSGLDRIVIFRVSRVWKGAVGTTCEMPAIETQGGFCTAFWRGLLVVGNELVVYASHLHSSKRNEYLPLRGKSILVSRYQPAWPRT